MEAVRDQKSVVRGEARLPAGRGISLLDLPQVTIDRDDVVCDICQVAIPRGHHAGRTPLSGRFICSSICLSSITPARFLRILFDTPIRP